MEKFVWVPPSREQIASMVGVYMMLVKLRRENPDWVERAIKKWYARQK
ncbi:MAG: hypothetical protein K2L25_00940 [Alphaproteobacteria bacterium]|nr:hypothetical protein [Alphaproteobacteria bacterium]